MRRWASDGIKEVEMSLDTGAELVENEEAARLAAFFKLQFVACWFLD